MGPAARGWGQTVTRIALLAALYLAGAHAGLAVAFSNRNVTTVWPPTGIAVAGLLIWGIDVWPGIVIGAFLANITNHAGVGTSAAIVVGNTAAPVVAALVLRSVSWFDDALERLRDVLSLLLVGGFGAMTISATLGTSALLLTHATTASRALSVWAVWWVGDAIGVVLFAPFLLLASRTTRNDPIVARLRETILLVVFAVAIVLTVFNVHAPLAYLILVPVVWAALSFEQVGASLVTIILAAIAVAETVAGHGPFASGTPTQNLASLQIFNAIVAFAGLSLACVASARRRAEDALRSSEARYRRLFERATDPIWIHDLDGRITYANHAAARVTGYPIDRLSTMSIFDLAGAHQEPTIRRAIRQLLEVGETTSLEIELRGPGGTLVALELSAVLVREGEPTGVQLIGRDITARNITEGQLRRNALRDPVTGLPNRTLVIERIEYALAVDDDTNTGVALVICDIDDFGRINTTDGRGAGDSLLRSVGHKLDGVLRGSDTIGRIGGDEFAVIVSPIRDADEAHLMARRISDAVHGCAPHHPTVCIGIAIRTPDIADVESLVRRADLAMRHAKRGGAGSIEMYGAHIEPDTEVFEDIRTRLERSLER